MLKTASDQSVDLMIATPHFYASRNTIDAFLHARESAYEKLCTSIREEGSQGFPQIRLGAEVAYFDGISQAGRISELTIRGTNILLLELPFGQWSGRIVKEVKYLIEKRGLCVVLAHLERYMSIRGNRRCLEELQKLPVLVQINAESLTHLWQGRKLCRMFSEGEAHLLGSDCHGIHHRVPNLASGREALRKHCGQAVLDAVDERGTELLASLPMENCKSC
jgi:protein-tyrosine phosphatase